jgi:hypothetical protein
MLIYDLVVIYGSFSSHIGTTVVKAIIDRSNHGHSYERWSNAFNQIKVCFHNKFLG